MCTHATGHAEVTQISFDPRVISYRDIVRHFFRMHDPTQVGGQGPDIGDNYRSAIFYLNDTQKADATAVREQVQRSFKKHIATEITQAGPFYIAEEYHQKFFLKTGVGACHVPYAPLENHGKED